MNTFKRTLIALSLIAPLTLSAANGPAIKATNADNAYTYFTVLDSGETVARFTFVQDGICTGEAGKFLKDTVEIVNNQRVTFKIYCLEVDRVSLWPKSKEGSAFVLNAFVTGNFVSLSGFVFSAKGFVESVKTVKYNKAHTL